MAIPNKRPLFREMALHQYMQSQEKDVLPRVIAPPTFLCCWILLGILIFAGLVAWWQDVPIFAGGSGIVRTIEAGSAQSSGAQAAHPTVLLFLPTWYAGRLHAGEFCHIRLYDSAPYLPCTITSVAPEPLRPDAIQARYQLNGIRLTRPVLVAQASLQAPLAQGAHTDELVSAQVQIGTRRLLTLLSSIDRSEEEGA